MSQFCQYENHDESPIIGACLRIDCKYSRSYCHHCIIKHHISHTDDLKTFKQLNEWIKQEKNSFQDLKQFINGIMQLSEGLQKFLVSITVNQQTDFSILSQKDMQEEIKKLIQFSMSKTTLIPLISKLQNDLNNLKQEINRINQVVVSSNNTQDIRNQEKNQQINWNNQQSYQIQQDLKHQQKLEKLNLEIQQNQKQQQRRMESLQQKQQEQFSYNSNHRNIKLDFNNQIQQVDKQPQLGQNQSYQSNKYQQFKYQEEIQYFHPFQKFSFIFIENEQINVENCGKMIRNEKKQGSYVWCDPSIPFDANVQIHFRILCYDYIELGIGYKGKSVNLILDKKYMIQIGNNVQYSFPLNFGDVVLLTIRMKEKKLIFTNQTSLYEEQISIDTSQVLNPFAYLSGRSCTEILDKQLLDKQLLDEQLLDKQLQQLLDKIDKHQSLCQTF
ncbi:unnamed protein product [Paramecium sonneborni]|uniref:Uncharacterized protein n=1 Tax=Paramecium sonneborni TaxID=65129 RepID=A0A8S1PQP7_9CILI|nr:unnamed protein product [Paramecium sonneborni]